MKRFAGLFLFVSCMVCATQVAAQPATIQITRPSAYLYAVPDAYIDVNGKRVVNLENGNTYKGTVRPGPVTIVVTNWQSPGHSTVSFKAAPGKTYRFIIEPRSNSVVAGLALGFVGMAIEGGGMFQITPRR